MGLFDRFHKKQQIHPQLSEALNDFTVQKEPCPFCKAQNQAKNMLTGLDGQKCCPRCGLSKVDSPDEAKLSLALTRARVYDYFMGALMPVIFSANEQQKEERLKQYRDEIQSALSKNDPNNMFVIYRSARIRGDILPCQMESMFMVI